MFVVLLATPLVPSFVSGWIRGLACETRVELRNLCEQRDGLSKYVKHGLGNDSNSNQSLCWWGERKGEKMGEVWK